MNISTLMAITPSRVFNLSYIILDSIFILFLCALLLFQKKKVTFLFSIAGGILYWIVDYGIFYLLMNTRVITYNGNIASNLETCMILLWMSLSYGITNFCFIWLALKKDKDLLTYTILIFGWWLVAPSLSQMDKTGILITTFRESYYHWVMALILVIGYAIFIVYKLFSKKETISLLVMNAIGIAVQFGWEFALLVNGIRPLNENSIQTLLVDSLIETNLGMPYFYLIFILVYKHYSEDLKRIDNKKSEI